MRSLLQHRSRDFVTRVPDNLIDRSRILILGHTIALDTTEVHEAHFRRACGTARYSYNWALARWKDMHAAGEKPSAMKIKAQWNAVRHKDFPIYLHARPCICKTCIKGGHIAATQLPNKSKSWLGRSGACVTSTTGVSRPERKRSRTADA